MGHEETIARIKNMCKEEKIIEKKKFVNGIEQVYAIIECTQKDKRMDFDLRYFLSDNDEEFEGITSEIVATLSICICYEKSKIQEFRDIEGISIIIDHFLVNNNYYWVKHSIEKGNLKTKGIGTVLWETMMDDGIKKYCQMYPESNDKNIFLSGRLSKADYPDNWKKSFPFYISIAEKIVANHSEYNTCRTIFRSNTPDKDGKYINFYDSNLQSDKKKLGECGREVYCEELIKKIHSTNSDGRFIIYFSN